VVPHVERPALDQLLDDAAATRRICVVVAAAGWGKTTTLAAWAARRRVAWLAIDARMDRAEQLVRPLLEALAAAGAPLAAAGAPPATRDLDDPRGAAVAFCQSLDGFLQDELVLVLDDLHEVPPGGTAARFIESLCRHLPDGLHLVLSSRADPPFSLERLRGQGLVTDIDASRLALHSGEVAALVEATLGDEAPELAARIREATAGWPAAARLAVEALRGAAPDERVPALERLRLPGGRLFAYLEEEVFARKPERVRELLRHLAVLQEVDLPLCRALGFKDPATLLAALTRRGLVQLTPGPEDSWALIRPLRDFVERGPSPSPTERADLHRRAGRCLAAQGVHARALGHLVAAGDDAEAARLLVEHGSSLVEAGAVDAVLAAAELAPEHLEDPSIQQVLGDARQVRGEWASAMACFNRAGRGARELTPALAWRMSLIPHALGELGEALALYHRARLGREDTRDEALLLSWTATAYRMTGDYGRCRELATRALAAAERCGDPSARCAAATVLAMLAAAQGDRAGSDGYCLSALDAATSGSGLLQTLRLRVYRGFHLLGLGLPRLALEEAGTALQLGEACGYRVLCGIALSTRGGAKAMLGRLQDSVEDFEAARDLLQRIGSRYVAWPLCGLGDVHRVRGELASAQAMYEEALALTEPTHEVTGLVSALMGLARVRAVADAESARRLAQRAVALGEGLRQGQALLTRGWVALVAGDREAASDDAQRAAATARVRRDWPGLAEALVLTVLAAEHPGEHTALLDEATQLWRNSGCTIEAAQAGLLAAHFVGGDGRVEAKLAEQTLREHGVDPGAGHAAGPLAMLPRAAPSIAIRALGAFQVYRDGQPVPTTAWRSKKARDLLKVLVSRRGRPVSREQVMELLWPEVDSVRAASRLSVLLSTVRNVLQPDRRRAGAGLVVADRSVVWLNLDQVDVDVEHFLAAAEDALHAHEQGRHDAVARLAAAEAQYGGDFLEDDPYQDWPVREQARASYLAVLRALARQLQKAGDTDRAVRYTLRLLEHDPYDEEAHLGLIRTLLGAGRRGEARRRYGIYEERMRDLAVDARPFPAPSGDPVSAAAGTSTPDPGRT
jgi:DNA-binding SARP family transcriptional activator